MGVGAFLFFFFDFPSYSAIPPVVVWHDANVWDLMRILRGQNPEVAPEARFDGDRLHIVARLVHAHTLEERPERWALPLPSAKTLLSERWPSIADVFCAESASVHIALRLPTINKKSGEELLHWAGLQDAMDVDADDDGSDAQRPNLRDMRRQQRIRTAAANGGSTPLPMPPRKRRRGVRKWAISVDATTGGPVSDAVTAAVAATDGGEEDRRRINPSPPSILCGLVDWFVRSLRHVTSAERDARDNHQQQADTVVVVEEPWYQWASIDDLVQQATARPEAFPLLHSLIYQTVYIIREYAAQTTRNDELQKYYNAAIWHLKPRSVSLAYLRHLLAPQLLSTPIGGIPRVHRMALHHDGEHDEFYVSTEGSIHQPVVGKENTATHPTGRCRQFLGPSHGAQRLGRGPPSMSDDEYGGVTECTRFGTGSVVCSLWVGGEL